MNAIPKTHVISAMVLPIRIALLLGLLVTPALGSSTWYVDDDAAPGGDGSAAQPFQAIGEAFAVAAAGDTVRVADGLYTGPLNRNLCGTFGLQLIGSGPATCVIDCESSGRSFDFDHIGETSFIEGFTIRNADATQGSKNSFTEGGALRLYGSFELRDLHIFGAFGTPGGGIFQSNGTLLLERVRVENCVTSSAGGAVWGTGRMSDCVFKDNRAEGSWGGALVLLEGGELLRCRFEGNSANSLGGAVLLRTGALDVSHCEFIGNSSRNGGGLQSMTQTPVRITNSLFVGNEALDGHGGAYLGAGLLEVTQCTIVNNRASGWGGGIRYLISEEATISNTILWGNEASAGNQLSLGYDVNPSRASVRYSNLEGGESGVHIEPGSELFWESGNIDALPRFRDAPAGDYRLQPYSPCVHRGSNAEIPVDYLDADGDGDTLEPMPIDLAGNPRVVLLFSGLGALAMPIATVDIGAYEAQ